MSLFVKKKRGNIMKISKVLTITALTVALGLSATNFASAKDSVTFNVAVIDIQKIVENSPQISALKTEQKNKLTDLAAFVEKAKADVAKQTDSAKKKALEANYNKELNTRKQAIDNDAAKKLAEFDKSVKDIISAKSADYDLVLTKNVVLKGGVDITSEIIKSLK